MTEQEFAALILWMVEQAPEREKMQALLFRILDRLFWKKEGASPPHIVYNRREESKEGEER
ncbi:MAG: hypothetical protein IJK63_05795 [Oscillospiraceae bacterium]|nr:hypothetical protein [Oscillospiraceae bacterium]